MFVKKKETPPRTIGLLTDFGVTDPYVGQVKAVLARKAPACPVVDISHRVEPFNVAQAGFFLASSYGHFPKDAVIMAVVDPGVGTDRRIVGISIGERILLAPDNGLLALALHNAWTEEVRAFDLNVALKARDKVARTFHGRDVFAPWPHGSPWVGRPARWARRSTRATWLHPAGPPPSSNRGKPWGMCSTSTDSATACSTWRPGVCRQPDAWI